MGRLGHSDYLLGNQCLVDDRRRGRPNTDVRECERAQSYSLAAEDRDGIAPRQAVAVAVDQSSEVVMETSGWNAVDAELDGIGQLEWFLRYERHLGERGGVRCRFQRDHPGIPGGEGASLACGGQAVGCKIRRLNEIHRAAEIDLDLGQPVFAVFNRSDVDYRN